MPGDLPWAAYQFVRDITTPTDGNHVHVHNLAIAELLFDARNTYVTECAGISWQHLHGTGRGMVLRRLEIDFEHEVSAGVALKVGVRAALRSRRTMTFHEAVWQVEPPAVIAVARSVHLVVRLEAPGAIEMPDDIIGKFESFEGRTLTWPSA